MNGALLRCSNLKRKAIPRALIALIPLPHLAMPALCGDHFFDALQRRIGAVACLEGFPYLLEPFLQSGHGFTYQITQKLRSQVARLGSASQWAEVITPGLRSPPTSKVSAPLGRILRYSPKVPRYYNNRCRCFLWHYEQNVGNMLLSLETMPMVSIRNHTSLRTALSIAWPG